MAGCFGLRRVCTRNHADEAAAMAKHEDNWTPRQWTDRDDALTADWLQHQGIGVTVNVATIAAETVAKDHSFHPIKEYLESLVWDGVERIANFAACYLGADTRLTIAR